MNAFRNRFAAALIVLFVLGVVVLEFSFAITDQVRTAIRLHAADQAQIQSYFELHTRLREFESEYRQILENPDQGLTLDFRAYRQGIDRLLLSLRAEIEREHIEREQADRSNGAEETSELARVLSLTNEIQSMLAGAEIAAALFRAGREEQGLKVLKQALDENVDKNLDKIIYEAVEADKAQLLEVTATILERLDIADTQGIIFFVLFLVILTAVALAVLAPFIRSMAALKGQSDKLALGGVVDPAVNTECREFTAVYDGLARAAAAQARLRDQLDACELEFSKRTDAMRQIDQVRRDFLADVSHELRTPLTVLRGVAEVALRTSSNDPGELKTTLARIVDESKHVSRIVDDLFFIARSQAGALDLRTDIVDFAVVSAAAEREAERLAADAGGRIVWRGLSKPVEVEGDADRLRQLFTILVDNAFKYGGRNPSVEVDLRLDGETILINVRDHGPGVPENDLPHVFERLYRGAVPTMAEPNGSGLGLPLAKSIVEGHGGGIFLSNAEGGGAVAQVSLPIFDSDALEVVLNEDSVGRRRLSDC